MKKHLLSVLNSKSYKDSSDSLNKVCDLLKQHTLPFVSLFSSPNNPIVRFVSETTIIEHAMCRCYFTGTVKRDDPLHIWARCFGFVKNECTLRTRILDSYDKAVQHIIYQHFMPPPAMTIDEIDCFLDSIPFAKKTVKIKDACLLIDGDNSSYEYGMALTEKNIIVRVPRACCRQLFTDLDLGTLHVSNHTLALQDDINDDIIELLYNIPLEQLMAVCIARTVESENIDEEEFTRSVDRAAGGYFTN